MIFTNVFAATTRYATSRNRFVIAARSDLTPNPTTGEDYEQVD